MINAGVSIKSFDGSQVFDAPSEEWQHIKVIVNYPEGQTPVDNPPAPGDVLVSTSGVVWLVKLVDDLYGAANEFSLNLQSTNKTPSEEVSPGLGQVSRAALLTPKKDTLVPFWSSQIVAEEVSRLAALYSQSLNERDNTSDLNKPISDSTQQALDTKVDKVTGKGLSTEDFTAEDKTALGGLLTAHEGGQRIAIRVNSWSTDDFNVPTGVTWAKEYDNTSLRITHSRGKIPTTWLLVNREANPMTVVLPSSLRNLQIVNDNEVIVTSLSSFEQFDLILSFQ